VSTSYRERNRTIRKIKNGRFSIEYDREDEDAEPKRWIAELDGLPGCLAYGATKEEAFRKVVRLAAHVLRHPKEDS